MASNPIELFLSNVTNAKELKNGQWISDCPVKDHRNAKLGFKTLPNGKFVFNCFAGCEKHEIMEAMGLQFSDLYSEEDKVSYTPDLTYEIALIGIYEQQLKNKEEIDPLDIPHIQAAMRKIKRYQS